MSNERLRDSLLTHGITQDDLAEQLGVDPKTVERWITQERAPYRKNRHKIATLLKQSENYLWPDAIAPSQKANIAESELVKLYPHRHSIPADAWDRLLGSATERIDVLVLAGLFLVERPTFVRDIKRKAKAGAKVRMIFGDPAANEAYRRSEEEQLEENTVGARIRNALALVKGLSGVEGVEIRLHEATLYNSIFRFDDEMIVNTHVYGAPGVHAPALHLRHLLAGDLFETYTESFETVWAKSVPNTL